jgi:hypothetical protein
MSLRSYIADFYSCKTRFAFTSTRILFTPFWALYTLLPFIMWKDLQATPLQIAFFVSLKPIVSLLAVYWSYQVKKRSDLLIPNIVWSGFLGHLPFLFVPWIDNPWYFVFASAIYMLFHRGGNPAWMEVLKVNVSEERRKTTFAYGSALYHVGGAILAIGIGWILDDKLQAWRWLFPITTLCAFIALFFQGSIPQPGGAIDKPLPQTLKGHFLKPWKEAWELVKTRPDFARFQLGFMLAGGGLMLWQPALPEFFIEILQLNYKELTIAITFCKSIGYALALPLWIRGMSKIDLFSFTSLVTLTAALFPLSLMAAETHLLFVYAAYLLYGAMQAGSELSWNLSGPIFSKQEESSTYTGVNVLTVGLRGCISPPLGGYLCNVTNATTVLLMGGAFCLLASFQLFFNRQREEERTILLSQD